MLDIRLLELSGGEYGLREVLLRLIAAYGKGNPVSEETFFDDFAEMTFPEIREFFDQYVLGSESLPHAEYFAKLGLEMPRDENGRMTILKMEEPSEAQEMLYQAWSESL